MQVVVKPIGTIRESRPARSRLKKRGHVYIDGPVLMRKGEMGPARDWDSQLAKVLTHLLGRETAPRRKWHRNIFMREQPEGPTEAEIMEHVRMAAAEIAMQIIPPEDLPRA